MQKILPTIIGSDVYIEEILIKLFKICTGFNLENKQNYIKEAESVIKIVGECVRETISNEKNQNKALITISKILYAKMYCLSSSADINRISEFTKRTTEEVESSLKLVKKIKNKIENEIN